MVASGEMGPTGAGTWGVMAAPWGAGAVRVGSVGGGCVVASQGAGEAGAGASFGGDMGAAPFLGAGFFAG